MDKGMKIAMIGAGKTGRGFIGRLLAEDNHEIYFIDKDKSLVDKLNTEKSFRISFFGNVRAPFTVDNYTAVTWENACLSDVEIIFVSVGGMNLADVGAELKKLIDDGKTRHIIVGENASKPAKKLCDAIGLSNITVSESTVFCTTIEDKNGGLLDIASENYPYLQCDAAPLGDYKLDIATVRPINGFDNFLTRKLYTYNAASCVIAYLGFVKGYTDYGAAANDPEILELLDRNYAATNKVLCKVYGYDEKDQAEFAALSKAKFTDRTIADTVSRNAREPQRKLAYAERIIGPLCMIDEHGEDTSVLLLTAAAALCYEHESDKGWQEIKDSKPPVEILLEICGLPAGSKLSDAILEKYDTVKKYMAGEGKLI
jgi:mannitol-1-phosphate 5-dehydrogenase